MIDRRSARLALATLVAVALATGARPEVASAQAQQLTDAPLAVDQFNESGSLQTVRQVSGLLGATLPCGRFTVIIPPGAVPGSAIVTVKVPDRSRLQCDLSISPASANHFLLPVTLIANGAGGSISSPGLMKLYWYEPSTDSWKPVGTAANAGMVMTATLRHFSIYAGGRAGW